MHSYRPGSSHKGQYVHRTTGQREEYGDRRRSHSTHHKYPEDPPNRRQYERSPQRSYSKDGVNRDRSRNCSARWRSPSPDRTIAEKKRRLSSDDYGGRRSPDDHSRHRSAERLHHSLSQEDTFHYQRSPPRGRHHESDLRHTSRPKESTHRRSPFRDEERYRSSRGHSQERISDCSSSNYSREKEEVSSPNHHGGPPPFSLRRPSGELMENDLPNCPVVPPKPHATKGFQKFLEVLNKGVNVDTLTRIVKVTAPSEAGNTVVCKERPRYETPATPAPSVPPAILERTSLNSDPGQSKGALSPEERHKHQELQHVLQAIGLDLGFDELGQMSSRIQERLYGKKEAEPASKGGKESGGRPRYSPNRHSRSSSSNRSGFMCYSHEDQEVLRSPDPANSQEDFHINNPPESPDRFHAAIPFLTPTPPPPQIPPATFPPANSGPRFYHPPPPFPPPLPFPPPALVWPPRPAMPSFPPAARLIVFPPQRPPIPPTVNFPPSQNFNISKPQARQRCLQVINIKK